jgi:crotonobetainyl-CoA:carnitine CoA-transferase CaiB-like acyl-CoA transferase
VLPVRDGNHRPGHEPSGVFPCAGEDTWIAIDLSDDAAWTRLAPLLGEPWASDTSLHEGSARAMRRADLEAALAGWTSGQERDELAERLLDAGVPAAPVNSEADLFAFPPVASHDYFQGCDREVVGFHLYPGLPLLHEGERLSVERPAPLLGEHTDEVLSRVVGEDTSLAVLREARIIAGPGKLPPRPL